MDDSIILKMSDACQHNVTLVFKDGRKQRGFVDTYDSRYDNDGEASICVDGGNGENTIIEESELEDIIINGEAE